MLQVRSAKGQSCKKRPPLCARRIRDGGSSAADRSPQGSFATKAGHVERPHFAGAVCFCLRARFFNLCWSCFCCLSCRVCWTRLWNSSFFFFILASSALRCISRSGSCQEGGKERFQGAQKQTLLARAPKLFLFLRPSSCSCLPSAFAFLLPQNGLPLNHHFTETRISQPLLC